MTRVRILILGGTGEGFRLAERLGAWPDTEVISSMAGLTPAPKIPVGQVRRGGFGGVAGLVEFLKAEGICAVIDATHPFASGISQNAALACAEVAVPVIHIMRPSWVRQDGDLWTEVDTIVEAADAVPRNAGLTFLTTGKTQLSAFAHRDDVAFLARVVAPISEGDMSRDVPSRLSYIYDRGPFDIEGETRLLQDRGVELIVTKNSGGDAAYAKLVAAREIGLPVIMVKRPNPPSGNCVNTVDGVLDWLKRRPEIGASLVGSGSA